MRCVQGSGPVGECLRWMRPQAWNGVWCIVVQRHHDMETIYALLALCEGNPLMTSGFPSQRAINAKLWFFFHQHCFRECLATCLAPSHCKFDLLWIRPLATDFSEISIKNKIFSFKKMHLKMSTKWHLFCSGLNVLSLQCSEAYYLYSWVSLSHKSLITKSTKIRFCITSMVNAKHNQSGTKPKLVAKIFATNFSNHLCRATKIGSQH